MRCSTCHQEIARDATTCPFCGAPVIAPQEGGGQASRRRANRLRTAAVAASLVAAISTGFGAYAWYQHHQVEASYHQAQANESESLAATAEQLLAQGNRMEAIQVALAALPEDAAGTSRPLVPAAQLALEHALQVYPQPSLWRSAYAIKEVRSTYAASSQGLQAFERLDGSVDVRSVTSGAQVARLDPRTQIAEVTGKDVDALKLTFCGETLIGYASGGIAVFDPAAGSLSWRASIDGFTPESDPIASPDGEHLAVACSFGPAHVIGDERSDVVIVRLINIADGSVSQGFKLPLDEWATHTEQVRLAYSPDGGQLAVANSGRLWLIDLATGDVSWTDLAGSSATDLAFAEGRIAVVSTVPSALEDGPEVAQLACYSPELYPLWEVPYEAGAAYDAEAPAASSVRLVATLPSSDDAAGQLVVTTGRTARYLSLDTGEELQEASMPAPIRASMLKAQLFLADHDGNVRVGTNTDDATAGLMQLTVTEGADAAFGDAEGMPFVAAYDADSSTYRTYLFCRRSNAPSQQPFKSKYLHVGHATVNAGTSGQRYLSFDENEVAGLDANTLKRQWKRSWAKLGLGESACSLCVGSKLAYAFETEHSGTDAPVICVLDPADGKVADRIELAEDWGSVLEVKEWQREGQTLLTIRNASTAAVIDATTHEELMRATAASGQIIDLWLGESALAVLEAPSFGGTANAFELFSLDDGSIQSAPLSAFGTKADMACHPADLDEANGMLAVSCSDGIVRAFSTADWSLAWEGTEEISGLSTLAYAPDGSSLLAQDNTGTCLLLSATDGHVLTTSSAALLPIVAVEKNPAHPELLTAVYAQDGSLDPAGIATISLDPACFGPLSDVRGGLYQTADGSQVLAHDPMDDPAFSTYHCYALGELIDLAHKTIEGHEFTDAERRLYRID